MGYTVIAYTLLNDLALIRIIEPASRLLSITLLKTYFGIQHRRQRYYEFINQINKKEITACPCTYRIAGNYSQIEPTALIRTSLGI